MTDTAATAVSGPRVAPGAWKVLVGIPLAAIAAMIVIAELAEWVYDGGGPLAAFLNSIVALVAMTAMVVLYAPLRPKGVPFSWGEAMIASTFIFLFMTVGYGIVPDQWIDLAAHWRWDDSTRTIAGDDAVWGWIAEIFTWPPFNRLQINYIHVRDIVVVVIYAVAIGINVWLWGFWQRRGERTAEVEPTSEYGRPLVRRP